MSDANATPMTAPTPTTAAALTCPACGSDKTAPTEGNAVGNTTDCRVCGHDFTPHATAAEREGAESVRSSEGFTVSVWREQIGSDRTQLNIHYPDGRFGFMIRLTDEERRQLAEALHPALLAARRDADRYRVLRTDAVLDGQFENDAAFDAWADPKLPSLGQEWVSRVTATDGPDVIGSDVESRRAYFARIDAECNEIRSQLAAARRENETLRDVLKHTQDERLILAKLCADEPQFFNPLEVYAAKKIRDLVLSRAALAATQETRSHA